MAKLPLSDTEFNLLVEHFASNNKENNVRWRDLCDVVDEVFMKKHLEKMKATQAVIAPSTVYKYGRRGLTEQEECIAENLKDRFRYFVISLLIKN